MSWKIFQSSDDLEKLQSPEKFSKSNDLEKFQSPNDFEKKNFQKSKWSKTQVRKFQNIFKVSESQCLVIEFLKKILILLYVF